MSNIVTQLQGWFEGLNAIEKAEVYNFLYGKGTFTQGVHLGQPPIFKPIVEGVCSGPPPDIYKGERCPTCHRLY